MVGTRKASVYLALAVLILILYVSWTPTPRAPVPLDPSNDRYANTNEHILDAPAPVSSAAFAIATHVPALEHLPGEAPSPGTSTVPFDTPQSTTAEAAAATTLSLFDDDKWFFEEDLNDYANPSWNVQKLRQYKPHNAKGPGHPTFGMYYATYNGSLYDPYFMAAQQVIYRLLWDPRSKTAQHPVTVWVPPFIDDAHRDWFRAAGADVRELALVEWHPNAPTKGRWRHLFSKLNLWNETDYSRIMFMDVDAFPLENVDGLLEIAEEEQRCNTDLLPSFDDKLVGDALCDYVFVGPHGEGEEVNVGVIVFKPSPAMHGRLLREFSHPENFNNSMAEQAFLTWYFDPEGPFPVRWVDREWDALFTKPEDEGHIKILHEKIWAYWFTPEHFAAQYFNETWLQMLELYNSKEFEDLRIQDGIRLSY